MSKVTDWAEQQSSESSGFTYPANSKTDDKTSSLAESLIRCQPRTSRVYSISTLLSLRHSQQPGRIELRIIPAALAECVFRPTSAAPRSKLHENLDPRRHTQSSNLTDCSTMSEAEVQYDKSYVRPLRQPLNPPEASLLQTHAGFARFLRQHASPPHHRVTAGGRIVPAGPLAPPPMLNLSSISDVLNGQSKNYKNTVRLSTAPLSQQNINVNAQKPSNFPHQVNQGLDGVTYPQYVQMPPSFVNENGSHFGPLPPGTITLAYYPDGTSLVYLNGSHFHTHWDGDSVTFRPVNCQLPIQPDTRYTSAIYPQAAPPIQPYQSGNMNGFITGQLLQNGIMNGSTHTQGQLQQPSQSEDSQALHSQLTVQLNTLDRYVALHMHEFSHIENAAYAAQRKQLVEQLDGLRVSAENGRLPMVAKAPIANTHVYNTQRAPLWVGTTGIAQNAAPLTNPAQDSTTNIKSASGQFSNSGLFGRLAPPQTPQNTLSPDAPPFVPNAVKAPVPDYFGPGHYSGPNGTQQGESKDLVKGQGLTNPIPGYEQSEKSTLRGSRVGSIDFGNTVLRTNPERQVSMALPVVTWKDIQYASRPGINPARGPKIYCTTISEFQEVIRRVREQAKLYGCDGGQSKDPAYDAEQDIRWAIADCDPIPLPKSPADHVANPRPWSWDDSAFNYRPIVKINPDWPQSAAGHRSYFGSENAAGDLDRAQTNSRVTEPRKGSFTGGPLIAATSARYPSDLSSPSTLQQKTNHYGSHESYRSGFQLYPGDSNGPKGISNASLASAGHVSTWVPNNAKNSNDARVSSGVGFSNDARISSDTRFHQRNISHAETSRQIEPGSRASSHRQQYQPSVENAPQTPTKSNAYSGVNLSTAGLSGQSRGSQQQWTPSNQYMSGRSGQPTFQTNLKHKDSWDSDADSQDSWFSPSDKESRMLSLDKRIRASEVPQQSRCEVTPSRGQNTTHYNTPISNEWANTPGSQGRNSDALSFDSQGIPRSDFNHSSKSIHDSLRAAKVNLPQTHGQLVFNQVFQTPPSVVDHQSGGGVKLNNFAGPSNNQSPKGFLRGMLKSPRYSAARNRQSEPFGPTQGHVAMNEHVDQNWERQHANKENIKSDGYQDTMGWRGRRRGSSLSSGELTNPWQDSDIVNNKAQSSLAGSSQHAFGQLPQYDGAGDALMSANDETQSADATASGPSSSKRSRKNKAKARTTENTSEGQYASRAEKARSYNVRLTLGYDFCGLRKVDFLPAPDRAGDMRAHGEYVDRYIDRVYEEDLDELRALNEGDLASQRRL